MKKLKVKSTMSRLLCNICDNKRDGIQIKETTDTIESIKIGVCQVILFATAFIFLTMFNTCLDIKLYGDAFFSVFESLVNLILAFFLSNLLFKTFCVEEVFEYEDEEQIDE